MKLGRANSFRTELLCMIKKMSPNRPRYCMRKGTEVVKGRRGERGRSKERETEKHLPISGYRNQITCILSSLFGGPRCKPFLSVPYEILWIV